jgi:hypothetical protein
MKRLKSWIHKVISNATLTILMFAVAFSSCSPVLYTPSTQNVPFLKEKGEVNIGGGVISTEDADGFSLNFAVAVDSNWAVAAAFNKLSGGDENSSDYWDSRGSYFEDAVGKFGSSAKGPWVYEGFLGLGYASIKNEKESNLVNTQFLKPYFQPSFGIRSKFVDIALTPRLAVVHYISEQVKIINSDNASFANDFFDSKKTTFVFEPGVTLKLGVKNFKLQLQGLLISYLCHVYGLCSGEIASIG